MDIIHEDRIKDRLEIDSLRKQLVEANIKIKELETIVENFKMNNFPISSGKRNLEVLLVVIGDDPDLKIDLATLRAVKRVSGLNFTRLLNATLEDFHRVMSEARLSDKPIKRVLFSVHANRDGILLDHVVNAEQLSADLQDVEILMIAGCESASIGQWLGVAKYVITLREKVPMDDASRFIEAYWTSIGKFVDPEDAFYDAINKVPTVGEYAEIHC